jgi:RNA polymerase sigma factor (sigma-70 family)
METVLRHLRRAALLGRGGGPTDGQLLADFLARRDGGAFEALLRRHGPMVLGVCRRVLGDAHDAEDAFQATFLVLVRKAAGLRCRERVGNWLYGVAYRTARKARVMNARRRARERRATAGARPGAGRDAATEELLERLDAELSRLPEKYRLPVVLCELEGRSRKEVARALGLAEGTLSWRLAQARKLLAAKLGRNGPALPAGAVAVALSAGAAEAAPSAALLSATARAGLRLAAGQALVGAAPPQVVSLTEGVLKAMFLTKLKVAAWAVGVALLVAAGAGGLSYQRAVAQPAPQPIREYGVPAGRVAPAPKVGRPAADDLESLRLEVEALRKELRATKDLVKALQAEVRGQKGPDKVRERDLESLRQLEDARRLEAAARKVLGERTTPPDPLADLEDAVKRLRKSPDDKKAAEALDRALRRLKERPKPNGAPGELQKN